MTLKATVKDRRLVLEAPADWPDGTEVEIHPIDREFDCEDRVLTPDDPIVDLEECLAALHALGPMEFDTGEREAIDKQMKEMDRLGVAEMKRLGGKQS